LKSLEKRNNSVRTRKPRLSVVERRDLQGM
jgi:hypothetical protein